MADAAAGEAAGKETVEGTVKSVVFHNDENGYTVLHVELPSDFELARPPEITVVGRAQAVWEGEEALPVPILFLYATDPHISGQLHKHVFRILKHLLSLV